MKNKSNDKFFEKDMYKPIHDYLIKQGYKVNGEVKNCDITAIKDNELIIVEMKRSFNVTLLLQATQRQQAADSVYVAVPRPKSGLRSANWKHICHLLRRLELGLMLVSSAGANACVEIVFHPSPFDRLKSLQTNKQKRFCIIKEIEGRYGNFNEGGSTRTKLMTAYRENAIHIACCLEMLGPLSPKKLKEFGTGAKTPSILQKNFYGWFERVEKGIYALTEEGIVCIKKYHDLAQHFKQELDGKLKGGEIKFPSP